MEALIHRGFIEQHRIDTLMKRVSEYIDYLEDSGMEDTCEWEDACGAYSCLLNEYAPSFSEQEIINRFEGDLS